MLSSKTIFDDSRAAENIALG